MPFFVLHSCWGTLIFDHLARLRWLNPYYKHISSLISWTHKKCLDTTNRTGNNDAKEMGLRTRPFLFQIPIPQFIIGDAPFVLVESSQIPQNVSKCPNPQSSCWSFQVLGPRLCCWPGFGNRSQPQPKFWLGGKLTALKT